MKSIDDGPPSAEALARRGPTATSPWRGDEHLVQVEAAAEAGLPRNDVELDSYMQGFSAGMTIDDSFDGAIVARGRTVLDHDQLLRSVRPPLKYLGIAFDDIKLRVHDGEFELRIAKNAAEASRPALESGKLTLRLWFGFGLLGLTCYQLFSPALGGILWGIGLLLGGLQLRRGMASGRAMLAGRVAMGLGMLAQQEQIILPPANAPTQDVLPG